MFESEPADEVKMRSDPSGTIIGLALVPVFLLFIYFGKAELGFTVDIVLAMALIAIKLHWKLRKHAWFWGAIGLVLALHVPLVFLVRWPHTNVPTMAYSMPLGIIDFLVISGAIRLAEKLFSNGSSSIDREEE